MANACELNKRVIYARDGAGRVVGRKLIGINADGCLIGFHTYTSLPGEAGNSALREVFRRYAADFAERCGLQLAQGGTVPTLFAEEWYDDGVVEWMVAEAQSPSAGSSHHRHHSHRQSEREDAKARENANGISEEREGAKVRENAK